jgi:hypothetical protein
MPPWVFTKNHGVVDPAFLMGKPWENNKKLWKDSPF